MRTLLRAGAVAVLIGLVYTAWLGWSWGIAVSSLLIGATLALVSDGIAGTPRFEMVAVLAWLYWGLSFLSNLIEAVYFRVIPALDAKRSALTGLAIALLAACVLGCWRRANGREQFRRVRIAPQVWWRIPLLALLFVLTYAAAGIGIQPWIASFYRNRPVPSLGQLAVLQFCRGLLDVACIFPILRRWVQSRQRAAWLSACVFTILCGWGPLLLPNRFMPAPIRLAHGVEMGVSGIVFGIVTAMLLLKPMARGTEQRARRARR